MARVGRFTKSASSARDHAPGSDFNYQRKFWRAGQNRYRIIGDIELIWVSWIDDKEGGRKPIFTHGPDPDSPLYQNDDGTPTGEPVHFFCKMVERMKLSPDPNVRSLAEQIEPKPTYAANCIDMDDPAWHVENQHTKLLCQNDKSNFFGIGIANDIEEQLYVYGAPDNPADYETYNNTGLLWVTVKKGSGKSTKYSTTAQPAPAPLTDVEAGYARYDLAEVCRQTPVDKVVEWLGWGYLKQHGVTEADIEAQRPFIPEWGKDEKNEGAGSGTAAPVASLGVQQPTQPAEPTPSEPAEPAEPAEPRQPADPAQQSVPGPDGDPLPPGIRFKMGTSGKPFFWHVSDTNKTSFNVADVVPQ